jgi:hypothetical protein
MNPLRSFSPLRSLSSLRALSAPAVLLGLLALTACDAEFDPGTQVDSLRVLAVRADDPFVHPGDSVRLQALAYDPQGRAITWAWAACPSPAGSAVADCLDQVRRSAAAGQLPVFAQGEGLDNVEVPVPADALDGIPAEARQQALAGIVSVACPGILEILDVDDRIPFRCTDRDSGAELGLHDMIVGVKKVFLREAEVNQNPIIDNILFDGEVWPSDEIKEVDPCDTRKFSYDDCKDVAHRIAAVVNPESFEAGVNEFGRDFSEDLIVQHYNTDGIFEDEVRIAEDSETRWAARISSSGSTQTLWFVVHDDRGGVSWTTRRVQVR